MRKSSRNGWLVLLGCAAVLCVVRWVPDGIMGGSLAVRHEERLAVGETGQRDAEELKASLEHITSSLAQQSHSLAQRGTGDGSHQAGDGQNGLGAADKDQLGALVDAAEARQDSGIVVDGAEREQSRESHRAESGESLLRWVDEAGRHGDAAPSGDGSRTAPRFWAAPAASSSGDGGCGDSCLDALGARLDGTGGVKGHDDGGYGSDRGGMRGPETVGQEMIRRNERAARMASDRSKFIGAQKRKMQQAIDKAWISLHSGHATHAKALLRQARFYHRAMLRLMGTSDNFSDHLKMPKGIQELRDAIYSESKGGDDVGTPAKLEDIMSEHFGKSRAVEGGANPQGEDATAAQHFGSVGGGAGGAWNAGGKQRIDLSALNSGSKDRNHGMGREGEGDGMPTITSLASGKYSERQGAVGGRSGLALSFEGLLSAQLGHGRHALKKQDVARAQQALKQASFYLRAVQDGRGGVHGQDASQLRKLRLQYEILKHAVENAEESKDKMLDSQVTQNLRALNAPIQGEDLATFTSDGPDPQETRKHQLFTQAVEQGMGAADMGDLAKAQGKLAEARYYAESQGYLRKGAGGQDARVAKRDLKMLAEEVIDSERNGGNIAGQQSPEVGLRAAHRRGLWKPRETRGARRWEGMYGDSMREEANGNREESGLFDRRARRVTRSRGRGHQRNDLADGVRQGSATYRAANGHAEDEDLREHKASRREKERCNTLSCLFGFGSHATAESRRQNANGRLKESDFGGKGTHMHTGLGLGRRLRRRGGLRRDALSREKKLGLSGASPGSLTSRASAVDAVKMVRAQQAADLSRSMSEAKVAYKKLLQREVKKEQGMQLSTPMIAIESPLGHSILAQSGKEASKSLASSALTANLDATSAFTQPAVNAKRVGSGTVQLINKYLAENKLSALPKKNEDAAEARVQVPVETPAAVAPHAVAANTKMQVAAVSPPRVVEQPVVRQPPQGQQGGRGSGEGAALMRQKTESNHDEDQEEDANIGDMLIRDVGKDLGLDS